MTRPLNFEFYDPFSDSLAQWPHIEAIADRARTILGPLSLVELNSLAQEGIEALRFYGAMTGTRGRAIDAIHLHRSMNTKRFGPTLGAYETILAALSLTHIDRAIELIRKSKRTHSPSKLAAEFSFLVSLAQDAVDRAENCEPNRRWAELVRLKYNHARSGGLEKGLNYALGRKLCFDFHEDYLEIRRSGIDRAADLISEKIKLSACGRKLSIREIRDLISDIRKAKDVFNKYQKVLCECDSETRADFVGSYIGKTRDGRERSRKVPPIEEVKRWATRWFSEKYGIVSKAQ